MRYYATTLVLALAVWSCGDDVPSLAVDSGIDQADAQNVDAMRGLTLLGSRVRFLSATEAATLLGTSDEFTTTLSPYDRGLRLSTTAPTTEADLLAQAATAAVDWDVADQAAWTEAITVLDTALAGLTIPVPDEILMIVTTGDEEFNAAYTRTNAIILPRRDAAISDLTRRVQLGAHELFHVITRWQPSVRDASFALLGFSPFVGVAYPEEFTDRQITNPDAFAMAHALAVSRGAQTINVVPLLYGTEPLDTAIQGNPFAAFELFLIEVNPAQGTIIRAPGQDAELIALSATDYQSQVSVNTGYIIHPEEAMADNFALLARRRAGLGGTVTVPALLDQLEALF